MAATEQVILVNEEDQPQGVAEKLLAHRQGLCHRAFSVFCLRESPELAILMQQRAKEKYHTPNLWTNTCCSHPRPGEDIILAAMRRLKEELGIAVDLKITGRFHYIAHLNNGLIENEVDHVLVGFIQDQIIVPNPAEVQAYRWVTLPELKKDLDSHPEKYTPWLKQALDLIKIANQFDNF